MGGESISTRSTRSRSRCKYSHYDGSIFPCGAAQWDLTALSGAPSCPRGALPARLAATLPGRTAHTAYCHLAFPNPRRPIGICQSPNEVTPRGFEPLLSCWGSRSYPVVGSGCRILADGTLSAQRCAGRARTDRPSPPRALLTCGSQFRTAPRINRLVNRSRESASLAATVVPVTRGDPGDDRRPS